MQRRLASLALIPALLGGAGQASAASDAAFHPKASVLELTNVTFHDGRTLPRLKLYTQTLGQPHRDANGEIDNAVLLLHATGGQGSDFLTPSFAQPLFAPGKPLDIHKFFVILPDAIGHGHSSKPSDGLRTRFPKYNYDDMVALQHRVVSDALGVHKLRLILGTSMGCMHTFLWGVTYPDQMRALITMACSPFPVVGMNWTWRQGVIQAIQSDPAYRNGNYTSQPAQGLQALSVLTAIAGGGAPNYAATYPSQSAVDAMLTARNQAVLKAADANDTVYQFSASKGYNVWPKIHRIKAPLLWWDSADDFINPPTLPYPQMALAAMKNFRYKLQPASTQTAGHYTFLKAEFFASDVAAMLHE